MRLKNSLYPYPVLGEERSDYEKSSFYGFVSNKVEFKNLVIDVEFQLDDDEIKNLILRGKAAFAIHIECSSTAYRQKIKTTKSNYHFEIPMEYLKGNIEIRTFIIALEKITDYTNPNFSALYKGLEITVQKNNILADGGGSEITLSDNMSSYADNDYLFKVQKLRDSSQKWFDVQYTNNDYILICMSEDLCKVYQSLSKGKYRDSIIAMIYVPVMMSVLNYMANCGDAEEEKNWYIAIVSLLEKNNISLDDFEDNICGDKSFLVVAQKIFQYPLEKAMNAINTPVE